MKKTIILSLVFLCLLNISSYGQETNNASGNFTITQNGAPIQGHYSIMPAAPDNIVLQLSPSAEFTLNAHIVDQSGKELIKIDAATVHLRYANSINISSLGAGNYFIEIKSDNTEESLKIPFSKS
ncbi:T9SS type A sorting domain-containing protein [Polluticoccus soli]|uniref:T9SS type A sorting domain-containing protein n=1 Tax=Polluticoccus soli TaxID=3034150 RepID=UPI0023E21D91|nr:T9SS type A sorting domain-containing protein [Flavipsychrobacter sp. JY13-12]